MLRPNWESQTCVGFSRSSSFLISREEFSLDSLSLFLKGGNNNIHSLVNTWKGCTIIVKSLIVILGSQFICNREANPMVLYPKYILSSITSHFCLCRMPSLDYCSSLLTSLLLFSLSPLPNLVFLQLVNHSLLCSKPFKAPYQTQNKIFHNALPYMPVGIFFFFLTAFSTTLIPQLTIFSSIASFLSL